MDESGSSQLPPLLETPPITLDSFTFNIPSRLNSFSSDAPALLARFTTGPPSLWGFSRVTYSKPGSSKSFSNTSSMLPSSTSSNRLQSSLSFGAIAPEPDNVLGDSQASALTIPTISQATRDRSVSEKAISPSSLNKLSLTDLFANAREVQLEWASVERVPPAQVSKPEAARNSNSTPVSASTFPSPKISQAESSLETPQTRPTMSNVTTVIITPRRESVKREIPPEVIPRPVQQEAGDPIIPAPAVVQPAAMPSKMKTEEANTSIIPSGKDLTPPVPIQKGRLVDPDSLPPKAKVELDALTTALAALKTLTVDHSLPPKHLQDLALSEEINQLPVHTQPSSASSKQTKLSKGKGRDSSGSENSSLHEQPMSKSTPVGSSSTTLSPKGLKGGQVATSNMLAQDKLDKGEMIPTLAISRVEYDKKYRKPPRYSSPPDDIHFPRYFMASSSHLASGPSSISEASRDSPAPSNPDHIIHRPTSPPNELRQEIPPTISLNKVEVPGALPGLTNTTGKSPSQATRIASARHSAAPYPTKAARDQDKLRLSPRLADPPAIIGYDSRAPDQEKGSSSIKGDKKPLSRDLPPHLHRQTLERNGKNQETSHANGSNTTPTRETPKGTTTRSRAALPFAESPLATKDTYGSRIQSPPRTMFQTRLPSPIENEKQHNESFTKAPGTQFNGKKRSRAEIGDENRLQDPGTNSKRRRTDRSKQEYPQVEHSYDQVPALARRITSYATTEVKNVIGHANLARSTTLQNLGESQQVPSRPLAKSSNAPIHDLSSRISDTRVSIPSKSLADRITDGYIRPALLDRFESGTDDRDVYRPQITPKSKFTGQSSRSRGSGSGLLASRIRDGHESDRNLEPPALLKRLGG